MAQDREDNKGIPQISTISDRIILSDIIETLPEIPKRTSHSHAQRR